MAFAGVCGAPSVAAGVILEGDAQEEESTIEMVDSKKLWNESQIRGLKAALAAKKDELARLRKLRAEGSREELEAAKRELKARDQ